MNVGVRDFIPPVGQHGDVLDRMRRRMDAYRQRHVQIASQFDGRYSEITERQRQETAAYHKRWLDSKAKRATNKSKAGQRGGISGGDSSTLNSNSYVKLKRKSAADEQLLSRKTPHLEEVNTNHMYNCEGRGSGGSQQVNQRKITSGNEETPNQQLLNNSLPPARDASINYSSSEVRSGFNSSVVTGKVKGQKAFDSTDFCKKEPHDDAQAPNTVDDGTDLMNFDDEGLCDFLNSIGQEGDFPPDILQVLNQGELENLDFHDSPMTVKDGAMPVITEQGSGLETSVPMCICSSDGSYNGIPASNGNGHLSVNHFSGTSGTQPLKVGRASSIVNDAGPAAETLKQMAARRSQDVSSKDESYSERMASQTFSYSLSFTATEYAPSAAEATVQHSDLYNTTMSISLAAPSLPALQSCLSEKNEQQMASGSVNSPDSSFVENMVKQLHFKSNQGTNFASLPSVLQRYTSIGKEHGLYSSLPNQNVRTNCPEYSALPRGQQTLGSSISCLTSGHLMISPQQPCFYKSGQIGSATEAGTYVDTGLGSTHTAQNHRLRQISAHPSLQYAPIELRGHLGDSVFLDKKQTKMPHDLFESSIKVEPNMMGCSQIISDATTDHSQQQFRNDPVHFNYSGSSYNMQQGTFIDPSVSSHVLMPNMPLFPMDSHSRTVNSNHSIISNQGCQPGVWKQTFTPHSSKLVLQQTDSPARRSQITTAQWIGYRTPKPQAGSFLHSTQTVPRLPGQTWNYSEGQFLQAFPSVGSNQGMVSSHIKTEKVGQLRRTPNITASGVALGYSGQHSSLAPQRQHSGNIRPSVSQLEFMSCSDSDALFNSSVIENSLELGLIEDLINGK